MNSQQQIDPTNVLIFLNCCIPLDEQLQLCHLTIVNGIIRKINVIPTNDADDAENDNSIGTATSRFDQSSFGKVSKTTIAAAAADSIDSFLVESLMLEHDELNIDLNDDVITTFECAGNILCPGFIDLQINGAFGVDFSNPNLTRQQVLTVASQLTQYGVTHFCPTLVSTSKDVYATLLHDILGPLCQSDQSGDFPPPTDRATLLGIHLEGPFFARSKRGAHGLEFIQDEIMQQDSIWTMYNFHEMAGDCDKEGGGQQRQPQNGVKIVTLAPELPGVERYEIIQSLKKKYGIVVSMGHTNATLQEGIKAVQNGAGLITHLFNAMRPFHHREPGLLGLLSMYPPCRQQQQQHQQQEGGYGMAKRRTTTGREHELFYSIIADGLHSHPTSIQMAYTLSKNVVLVTDGIAAMGLKDGQHALGEEEVMVLRGKATIRGTDTLAGSVATMDSCIRSFQKFTGCSVYEALKAATENPARVLNLEDELGRIQVGRRADFVILDKDLIVQRTIIGGNIVHQHE
jgi:N-acetylglucosamine-6-phosphate deacetylase